MTGQGLEPTGGHPREVEFRDARGTDLFLGVAAGAFGRVTLHDGSKTRSPDIGQNLTCR